MKAVKFKNFSGTEFTWKYDGIPYTFDAGQEIFLEDFKAEHFAKHLADREMNAAGIPTNDPSRKAYEAKCFPSDVEVTPLEALNLNEEAKPKRGKAKKEEEFPDLNK